MQNADPGRAAWPAFRAVAMVCAATVFYFIGVGLLIPEVPRFLAGPGGTALARPAAGWLVYRVGQRAAVVWLLAVEGGGLAAAAAWPAAAGLLVAAALLAAAQALGLPVFILLAVGRLPAGGRTGAVAAVTAGYDIGYGAAAAGLGTVAGRAGYAAMFWAAALVTVSGAALALRIGDSSQRRETS